MLVAPRVANILLCVGPAFEEFAHGDYDPPVRALALQDEQSMRQRHKAHAQMVCWASLW